MQVLKSKHGWCLLYKLVSSWRWSHHQATWATRQQLMIAEILMGNSRRSCTGFCWQLANHVSPWWIRPPPEAALQTFSVALQLSKTFETWGRNQRAQKVNDFIGVQRWLAPPRVASLYEKKEGRQCRCSFQIVPGTELERLWFTNWDFPSSPSWREDCAQCCSGFPGWMKRRQ